MFILSIILGPMDLRLEADDETFAIVNGTMDVISDYQIKKSEITKKFQEQIEYLKIQAENDLKNLKHATEIELRKLIEK